MTQWLNVRKSDDRVVGWQRSSGGVVADDAETRRVVVDDAGIAVYFALQKQAGTERRKAVISESGGILSLEADTRPFVRIESDKAEINADGVDAATVTFTLLNPDGTTNPVNVSRTVTLNDGRRDRTFRLTFVSGIATKQFRTKESGLFRLDSTNEVRFESPLEILAVE